MFFVFPLFSLRYLDRGERRRGYRGLTATQAAALRPRRLVEGALRTIRTDRGELFGREGEYNGSRARRYGGRGGIRRLCTDINRESNLSRELFFLCCTRVFGCSSVCGF